MSCPSKKKHSSADTVMLVRNEKPCVRTAKAVFSANSKFEFTSGYDKMTKESTKPVRGQENKELRMDRHSASPKSHCDPNHSMKKEGAGGKFTWGGLLDPVGPVDLDKHDPNFVEDQEEIQ